MKAIAFVLLFVAAVVSADHIPIEKSLNVPEETIQKWKDHYNRAAINDLELDINEYIDELFEEIDNYMVQAGLDPVELDEIHEGFEFKILLITYHGELDLTNGWLQDLSTLHRTGNASVAAGETTLTISIPLGFDQLMFDYQYSAKLMNLGPTGGIDGKVKDIRIDLEVDIDLNTSLLSLKTFKITNTGKISFKFSGNALVDWMTNLFTSVLTTLMHGVIVLIAQTVIKGNLEDVIDQINDALSNIATP